MREEAMVRGGRASGSGLRWLGVSLLVLILDFVSKRMAKHYLVAGLPLAVFPHFNLTLAFNRGAAFSFLAAGNGWQNWFFAAVAILATMVIIILLARLASRDWWLCLALALIPGGALGNLADRLLYGHVIDFLDFYIGNWHFAIFNLADAAICIGAFMLLLDAFQWRPGVVKK